MSDTILLPYETASDPLITESHLGTRTYTYAPNGNQWAKLSVFTNQHDLLGYLQGIANITRQSDPAQGYMTIYNIWLQFHYMGEPWENVRTYVGPATEYDAYMEKATPWWDLLFQGKHGCWRTACKFRITWADGSDTGVITRYSYDWPEIADGCS